MFYLCGHSRFFITFFTIKLTNQTPWAQFSMISYLRRFTLTVSYFEVQTFELKTKLLGFLSRVSSFCSSPKINFPLKMKSLPFKHLFLAFPLLQTQQKFLEFFLMKHLFLNWYRFQKVYFGTLFYFVFRSLLVPSSQISTEC